MNNNPVVVYTAGVWDLLHVGHINLLWRSKNLGDILIVGVVSDTGTAEYKNAFPQENVQQRLQAVARLAFVDVVVVQRTTNPRDNIARFRPNIMTHGSDWNTLIAGQDALEEYGVEWVVLPYTPNVSTTILRQKLQE